MIKEFPYPSNINEASHISNKNRSFIKIMQPDYNNILLNTHTSIDNEQYYLQETYTFNEGDDIPTGNVNDNINVENLQKVDFTKYFVNQPSQKDLGRTEGNFALSHEIDKSKSIF
jgi:hypothetical protein